MRYEIDNTKSITESVSQLKDGDTLFLKNGIYNEKVEIIGNNINIIGESEEKVIIQNKDWYSKIMPDYNECNTFRTETVFIHGENIKISNLTIINLSTPSSKYGQALALYADANNLLAKNITLKSEQDTLFTGPLPKDLLIRHKGFLNKNKLSGKKNKQIYDNCTIIGNVDFIFGSAYALFINSKIIDIDRSKENYICAPSHDKDDKFGFLFYKCDIIHQGNIKMTYLARPWRDYGQAAFILCNMNDHIVDIGYDRWTNSQRDKTARFYEYTENIDTSKRAKWAHILNKSDAEKYVKDYFEFIGYKKD